MEYIFKEVDIEVEIMDFDLRLYLYQNNLDVGVFDVTIPVDGESFIIGYALYNNYRKCGLGYSFFVFCFQYLKDNCGVELLISKKSMRNRKSNRIWKELKKYKRFKIKSSDRFDKIKFNI